MRATRTAPLAGIAFVVVSVAAWIVSRSPDSNDPVSTITAYYSDKSNRVLELVSAYLFVGARDPVRLLRRRPARAVALGRGRRGDSDVRGVRRSARLRGAPRRRRDVGCGGAGGHGARGIRAPDGGDIINFGQSAGYGMILVGGMLFAATTIVAISFVSMRTAALPRWSAWLGYLCALVLLFAVVWLPQIALLVWVIAICIVLLRTPARAAAIA